MPNELLELLVAYSIFCLGCGFLQAAANKTPGLGPDALPLLIHTPLLFASPTARFVVGGIGILSLLVEIALGFILIAWWAGLFFWFPANQLARLLARTKNPAPAFFVGLFVTVIGIILLVSKATLCWTPSSSALGEPLGVLSWASPSEQPP